MKYLLTILLFLAGFILPEKVYTQISAVDPTFNPTDAGFGNGDGLNNGVRDMTIQPNGKVLITGVFTSYNGTSINKVARLNTVGQLDAGFDPGNALGSNPAGAQCIALQSDGKIFVGGYFGVARFNPNGSQDITFNSLPQSPECCAIQADGKILLGISTSIRRLNSDGTLDTTFHTGTGPNGNVYSIVVQPDGKILIGGVFSNYNMVSRKRIARLNSDGTLDTTFNSSVGVNDNIYDMAIQPDGKIVIVGAFTNYGGISRNRVARLNSDGTLDTTFTPGTGANTYVLDVVLQPDGKILIGGVFSTYNGISRNKIARLNSDGSLDNTFNPGNGANDNVFSIGIQSDGKIVIGGAFTSFNGYSKKYLVRLNSNGSFDDDFSQGTGANSTIYSLCSQPNGKILIGGAFTNYNGASLNRIARLNDVASLDTVFDSGSGVDSIVHSIILQPDEKIIIGGAFTNYNGVSRNRIVRLNDNGGLDTIFDPGTGTNGTIYGTAIQSDGKILIVGAFTDYNGVSRNRIARINEDGSLDLTFNPGSGLDNTVYEITVQPDGKILVGGAFTNYNGVPRNRIVRLNSDGTLDLTFTTGTGFNGTVFEIVIQPDGKIVLGGAFTSYGGTSRNRIARLNSDGTLDLIFNPGTGPNGTVYALRLYPDGKVLIAGNFTTFSGVSRNRITRLYDHGSIDVSYNPGTGANNTIYCNFIQPDDKILIAGDFTSYNGVGRNRIARLFSCYPTNNTINQTVCNSYTLNNITYTSSGIFTQTLINSVGCDSIITLNLTILSNNGIDIQTTCDSLTWIDGNTYYSSTNTPTFVLQNVTGCDSIVTLNLIITNSNTGTDSQTACDSLIWIDGNTYYSSTNTPTFVLQNTVGCDSIVSLNLTVTHPNTGIDVQTACDSLMWIDEITYYSSTNTPTFVLQNASGCDSVVTLNLTVSHPNSGTDVQTTCTAFTWIDGNTYYSSTNTPTFVLQNAAGCDSVITLNLTVLAAVETIEEMTHCGPFTWPLNGQTYGFSGYYTDTVTTLNGCDSIVHLNIHINPIPSTSVIDNGNGSFTTTYSGIVEWIDCSTNTLVGTGHLFTPTQNGNYALAVINGTSWCSDTSDCILVDYLGIESKDPLALNLSPNPTNDQVHISFSGSDAELTVYDLQGKVVLKDRIQNQGIISLQNFERGVYLFDFKNSQGHSVQRVVKQ